MSTKIQTKINISEHMRELVHRFGKPIEELGVPRIWLNLDWTEGWNEDYAIAQGFYYEKHELGPYFDTCSFEHDVENRIKKFFKSDPTVKIKFRWSSQELEVFR